MISDEWEIYDRNHQLIKRLAERTGRGLSRKYVSGGKLIPENVTMELDGKPVVQINQQFKIVGDIWVVQCHSLLDQFDRRVFLASVLLMAMIERQKNRPYPSSLPFFFFFIIFFYPSPINHVVPKALIYLYLCKQSDKLPRVSNKISSTVGLPPGTLLYTGKKRFGKIKISLIDYDDTHFTEQEIDNIRECVPFKDKSTVTWINIDGIHDVQLVEKIGTCFDLHSLVLEDILNSDQRPKVEEFESHLFLVLKMLQYDEKEQEVIGEQVSLILGSSYVLSFQEREGDVFNIIRERIRKGMGRIRKMPSDYLAYALIDAIVDNYFSILEKIGEKIGDIETEVISNPTPETLKHIYSLKRDMIFLRKSVWPLREVINVLERGEIQLINKTTEPFLRDVYEHTIQVMDTIESYRDMISGMLDIYLSSVSNKMNDIMKILTIIATIFIPLTFIAGIYGMNFHYMPELGWHWGYFTILSIMLLMGLVMIAFFRKKKWL